MSVWIIRRSLRGRASFDYVVDATDPTVGGPPEIAVAFASSVEADAAIRNYKPHVLARWKFEVEPVSVSPAEAMARYVCFFHPIASVMDLETTREHVLEPADDRGHFILREQLP